MSADGQNFSDGAEQDINQSMDTVQNAYDLAHRANDAVKNKKAEKESKSKSESGKGNEDGKADSNSTSNKNNNNQNANTAGKAKGTNAQAGTTTTANATSGASKGAATSGATTTAGSAGSTGAATAAGSAGSAGAATASGTAAGSAAGTAAGTATGAAAGSAVAPGVGTAAGAAVGLLKPLLKYIIVVGVLITMFVTLATASLPRVIFGAFMDLIGFKQETITLEQGAGQVIGEAYTIALGKIITAATVGGFNMEYTMENIVDATGSADNYDMAYIISAYSIATNNEISDGKKLVKKLKGAKSSLYKVEMNPVEEERLVPHSEPKYNEREITIMGEATSKSEIYYELDEREILSQPVTKTVPVYRPVKVTVLKPNGETEEVSVRKPDGTFVEITTSLIDKYSPVYLNVYVPPEPTQKTVYEKSDAEVVLYHEPGDAPVYSEVELEVVQPDGTIETETHMDLTGTTPVEPSYETIRYLKSKIHAISRSDLNDALGLDLSKWFIEPQNGLNGVTNYIAVQDMLEYYVKFLNDQNIALGRGLGAGGLGVPVEPPDFSEIYPNLEIPPISDNRKLLLEVAGSILGKVSYVMGGGHNDNYYPMGWNPDWSETNGLDCSGYVSWVYSTTFGRPLMYGPETGGTALITDFYLYPQYTYSIAEESLQPGDIGHVHNDEQQHTGIFIGYIKNTRTKLWIHASGRRDDIKISAYPYFTNFLRVSALSEEDYSGDNLRQEADLMSRLGVAVRDTEGIDYTTPEYSWLASVPNQPEFSFIPASKTMNIEYYCMCETCSGKSIADITTFAGNSYRVGVVASNSLPIGTKIGLYGKMFTVEDVKPGNKPVSENTFETIYVYVPRHDLLSNTNPRTASVPIYP